jgi:hypothetical protein
MTNAIKVLLQIQSGFLQLESTLNNYPIYHFAKTQIYFPCIRKCGKNPGG